MIRTTILDNPSSGVVMKNLPAAAVGKKAPSLLFCVVMDLIGYATYAVPVLGEFGDLLWAPISALIFFRTFGGWKGAFGGIFNFIEEILPGLDFIPTFTLTWLFQNYRKPSNSGEQTGKPVFRAVTKSSGIIHI
jgi:hypothetical protein